MQWNDFNNSSCAVLSSIFKKSTVPSIQFKCEPHSERYELKFQARGFKKERKLLLFFVSSGIIILRGGIYFILTKGYIHTDLRK